LRIGRSWIARQLQDLQCHQALKYQMLAQIDLAHPAGADEVQNLVLIGDEKPLVQAALQLARLIRRQQALVEKALDEMRSMMGLQRQKRREHVFAEQAAAFNQYLHFRDRLGRGHNFKYPRVAPCSASRSICKRYRHPHSATSEEHVKDV